MPGRLFVPSVQIKALWETYLQLQNLFTEEIKNNRLNEITEIVANFLTIRQDKVRDGVDAIQLSDILSITTYILNFYRHFEKVYPLITVEFLPKLVELKKMVFIMYDTALIYFGPDVASIATTAEQKVVTTAMFSDLFTAADSHEQVCLISIHIRANWFYELWLVNLTI